MPKGIGYGQKAIAKYGKRAVSNMLKVKKAKSRRAGK
jgi:hypothetical protein